VSYEISLPPLQERAPIFTWLMEHARLGLGELARTFNLGIGMVLVVKKAQASKVLAQVKKSGDRAWMIGQVVARKKSENCLVRVTDGTQSTELVY
jgi:phosphoribosylformylglycinamidine cyclo-ligase